MGTRKHIPVQVKERIVGMSRLPRTIIARNLECSRQTVHRVLQLAAKTGTVVKTPIFNGERRLLNAMDLVVRRTSILICGIHGQYVDSSLNPSLNAHQISTSTKFKRN